MKTRFACSVIVFACIAAHGGETSFDDVLARVSNRNSITKAILNVDQHRRFRLEIEGDQAKVTIWKHMKIRDPDEEIYTFPASDVIRQEHARLALQDELNDVMARCADSERRFRVSQYKKHPISYGMSYQKAKELLTKELLKDAFKPDGLQRTEEGAYRLESDTHSIVFRHGVLVDVITKHNSNKPDVANSK